MVTSESWWLCEPLVTVNCDIFAISQDNTKSKPNFASLYYMMAESRVTCVFKKRGTRPAGGMRKRAAGSDDSK